MSNFPWLTVAGAIPLAGAIVIALTPGRSAPGSPADKRARDLLVKRIALVFSLATLVVTVVMAVKFKAGGPRFQFQQVYQWIPQFGVHYAVGVDGIALVLIVMSAILMPVVVLASWHDVELGGGPAPAAAGPAADDAETAAQPGPAAGRTPKVRSVKSYFALMLVLETMMIGVFAATDVFLFYVFFEAMLVPMYFMIGSFGVGQRQYAAVKFLLYSLLGGLLMLVAVIALYVYSMHGGHQGTFLFSQLSHVALSSTTQKWLFLGFFVAFAIKAPLWPFHTWLPDAATSAQPGAAVLLVGVLDKVGTFGMIRYCLELFPAASHFFTPLIITLAVVGILYGAVVAIGQADMKRLIAYSSVSHMGLITLGIFAMTSQGQAGATLYMVNHGFATGALFILAGFMVSRRGSHLISDYGGVQKVAPVLAGLFLIAGLAGLALPGLSTFVSEFLVLVGTFTRYEAAAVLATVGIILAAIYILWMYQRTMTGPVREELRAMPDLKARELWAIGPLIALIVVLGVYPKPVLDIINPAVHSTLVGTHSTDPVPPHPATAQPGPVSTSSLVHGHGQTSYWLARATQKSQPELKQGELGVTGTIAAVAPTIATPHIEWSLLSPMLLVFAAALVGVLVEAFAPRDLRRAMHIMLALGSLAGAFVLTVVLAAHSSIFHGGKAGAVVAIGTVGVDRPTLFIQATVLILAFVSVLLIAESSHEASAFTPQAAAVPGSAEEREGMLAGLAHTEVYPLTLFAVGGMLLFPAANDLLTMFIALEVLSLPLYLLCGLARRRRLLSQEAAMKYFLLGAFSSAIFLFGVAMLYGYSGSVQLAAIASAAQSGTASATLLYAGIALLGVGLLFKIGAVPFQAWKPDVYQGSPTPITALMASCTLVSAFGALLRVFYVAFGQLTWDWRPAMWGVAILTMLVGSIIAITQTDMKRLLAYSSIAQAGYILTGVIAANAAGLSGSLFYLAAYGFATIGAFAIVTLVRDRGGEAAHMSSWAGLGKRSPLIAGVFALFLIAFAGIPLTSGFTGKFAVFRAAIEGGALPLVIIGVISSAILAFPYVRVIVLMFFSEPAAEGPVVIRPSAYTGVAVGIGALATIVLGIVPQPLLNLANHAASQLFVR